MTQDNSQAADLLSVLKGNEPSTETIAKIKEPHNQACSMEALPRSFEMVGYEEATETDPMRKL